MKQFTSEEIQARFNQLPKVLQDAVSSSNVHNDLMAIAKKYGLHIDQEGELVDQVGLVMLGLSSSKDFVKNFSSEAGISSTVAAAIAADINASIFSKIRSSMRLIEEKVDVSTDTRADQAPADPISDLERVGGFSIERRSEEDAKNRGDSSSHPLEEHDELVTAIEDPASIRPKTEPLIDQLLSGPVVAVTQKSVIAPSPAPTSIPAPKSPPQEKGPDPYREPIA
jgi:hypothetical protein